MARQRRCYNYRTVFKKPIVIHKIDRLHLPFGIELKRLLLGIPIFGVLWLLKKVLLNFLLADFINNPTILALYYILPIYFASGYLAQEHDFFDGKTVYSYFKDYLSYYFKIRGKRIRYKNDQELEGLESSVTFSKTRLK